MDEGGIVEYCRYCAGVNLAFCLLASARTEDGGGGGAGRGEGSGGG